MIKKSAKTYLTGFIMGVMISAVLLKTFPSIYYAFTEALAKKLEIQQKIIPSLPLMLIANNILASLICAFGGYFFVKIYLKRDIKRPNLYHITLSIFPIFVLFTSGFVLGAFLPPFIKDLASYFSLLLPHGIFELPATILSGSIGFDIAGVSPQIIDSIKIFEERIDYMLKSKMGEYKVVLILI
ncbi:MAG: stage II sporulation protein M, partial [Candidatus Hydrothermarchaeales archaeon]